MYGLEWRFANKQTAFLFQLKSINVEIESNVKMKRISLSHSNLERRNPDIGTFKNGAIKLTNELLKDNNKIIF